MLKIKYSKVIRVNKIIFVIKIKYKKVNKKLIYKNSKIN